VRQIAPEVPLALIGDAPGILQQARDDNLPWIHVRHETLSVAVIEDAHTHGIRVNAWTVDDPEAFATWQCTGLDKLCTNCPGRMLSRANQTG
jgi:glycerophosphoryl diester phosphodiesterase